MFCEHCGTKLENDNRFCKNCGNKIVDISNIARQKTEVQEEKIDVTLSVGVIEFYSEDWRRKKGFTIESLSYYDVIIDKNFLYLIRMPVYGGQLLGLVLGLILLNILGAIIGSSMGNSSDTKKRGGYRSSWIKAGQLISNDYAHNIFLKMPLEKLKGNLIFGENKFILTNGDQTVIFKKDQTEFERFRQSIKKYVL